uniref:ATP-dependent DNA helicase n=1 Tax=Fopius arisanus TaxID=64838 RepID=A0A0C9QDU9_9HYME
MKMAKSSTQRAREYRARVRARKPANAKKKPLTSTERSRSHRARREMKKAIEMNCIFIPENREMKQEPMDEESPGPSTRNSTKLSRRNIKTAASTSKGSEKRLKKNAKCKISSPKCFYCGRLWFHNDEDNGDTQGRLLRSLLQRQKRKDNIVCSTCRQSSSRRVNSVTVTPSELISPEDPGIDDQLNVHSDPFTSVPGEMSFEDSKDHIQKLEEISDEASWELYSPEISSEDNKEEVQKLIAEQSLVNPLFIEDNKDGVRKLIATGFPSDDLQVSSHHTPDIDTDDQLMPSDNLNCRNFILQKPEEISNEIANGILHTVVAMEYSDNELSIPSESSLNRRMNSISPDSPEMDYHKEEFPDSFPCISSEITFEDNKDELRRLIAEQSLPTPLFSEDNNNGMKTPSENPLKRLTIDKSHTIIETPETLCQNLQFHELMELANDYQKILLMQVVCSLMSGNRTPFEIFFTCSVKSGRTFVLRLLIEIYNRYKNASGHCNVYSTCVSTGKPTATINDTKAVHLALKISLPTILSLSDQVAQQYRTLFQFVQVIVIDEVSIVCLELLAQIEARMKEATGNFEKAFGGMDVVLVGDLWQLPTGSTDQDKRKPGSSLYSGLRFYELHKVFQKANSIFLSAVMKVGCGAGLNQIELDFLESRVFTREEAERFSRLAFRLFPDDDYFVVYQYNDMHSRHILYSMLSRAVGINRVYVIATDEVNPFRYEIGNSVSSRSFRGISLDRAVMMHQPLLEFLWKWRLKVDCRSLKQRNCLGVNGIVQRTAIFLLGEKTLNDKEMKEKLDIPNFDCVVRFKDPLEGDPRAFVSQRVDGVSVVTGYMDISLLRVRALSVNSSEVGEICITECILDNGQTILNALVYITPGQTADGVSRFLHRTLGSLEGGDDGGGDVSTLPMILSGKFNLDFSRNDTRSIIDFLECEFSLAWSGDMVSSARAPDAVFSRNLNELQSRLFVSYYSCEQSYDTYVNYVPMEISE